MTLDDWTSSESPVVVYVSDDRVYEKIEFEYSAGSKTLVWFEDHHSVFDVMESMPEIDVEPEPQVELEKTGSDNTMLVVVGVILLIITVATVVFYTRKN